MATFTITSWKSNPLPRPDPPRIKIGNQTAFSAAKPTDPFDYALANGFDAFEWFPDKKASGAGWDEQDLTPELRKKIKAAAKASDMRLSVHGRWQADPIHPDALAILLKDLELTRELEARLLNIHLYTEQGLPTYVKAIQPLIRRAAEWGIQLSIENSPENTPEQFNELFQVLRRDTSTSLEHVGMCFDLGHANLCQPTRNFYLQYLAKLEPSMPLIHLHLHENWGDADSHLPLFTGPAGQNGPGLSDFIRLLRARGYAGSMILESWPEPPILLNQARDKLLQLIREVDSTPPSPVNSV